MNIMKPKIPIVDEQDNIIDYKDREAILPGDIYRVSSLWIINSHGEVLLARRAYNKSHDPGKWGPAVAGTIEKDETYESNIKKEAEEELGLIGVNFEKVQKHFTKGQKWSHFTQLFQLVIDKPVEEFKIQEQEVAEVRWFSKQALAKELEEHPDEFLASTKSKCDEFVALK
jgi:16S rRNA (adenine1518-N6/adenine1519-N6)-dimethyltransferase